jgi:hypothetical protein
MFETQDPFAALIGFQEALTAGFIQPSRSSLYPDLVVLQDDAEGTPRLTYALIDGQKVKAVAVYFLERKINSIPHFDLGYAVAVAYRNQGYAHAIVEKSLAQLQHEMRGHVDKFFVEAIVPNSNIASKKVAALALSADWEEIRDSVSGKPSARYLRLFEL